MEASTNPEEPRRRFDATLRDLRGRRVTRVGYWDVHNVGPEPAVWDYGDWHHAVMGVQLDTDRGPVTVTWTATFFPYGVEVFPEPISHHLVDGEDGPQRVGPDPGSPGPWDRCLGVPIQAASACWERLNIGPARRADGTVVSEAYQVDVPVAIQLDFDAGSVWFVAGMPQFPAMDQVFIPGDEIMVVFTPEKMRAIGFGDTAFSPRAW